jgi:hypothetical protein
MATPERARGWLQTILEVTDRATSVTLLLMLVIGGLFGHFALQELRRVHAVNQTLWEELQTAHKAQLDLALRCDCARAEER